MRGSASSKSLLSQEIDDGEGDVLVREGRLEESPDAAGEVAFQAADRFAGGLAFAASTLDVVACLGWQRARVTITRCRAALIWRVPPRARRRGGGLPGLAGGGAAPAGRGGPA